MTPEFLKASILGDNAAAEKYLGATLPSFWPDIKKVLTLRFHQLQDDPTLQPWLLRGICHKETGAMIGHIGFHTAPNPDYLTPWITEAIEFGFTVFPDYRRMGYATEASKALMQWARNIHNVSKFVLTISPDNAPSQNLAASLGFKHIGSHVDDEDGSEDILAWVS